MTQDAELKIAIYDKLTSTSDFNTNIGSRVYFQQAQDSATYPYCVYSIFADDNTFDSGNQWEDVYIQFSIFDENTTSVNLDLLTSNLIDLLYGATLSFTNYTQISFERIAKRNGYSTDDTWNKIIEYKIVIEHN